MEHNILLISDGIFHPSLLARYWFNRALPRTPELHFERLSSLAGIQSIPLQQYSAIICYFHHKEIERATLERLEDYVQSGGGILAVHSASASFKDETRYHALIGGRFDHHGPIKDFEVFPTQAADPIFPPLEAFTVRDELYMHSYDPAVTVHFGTHSEGKVEPVVWTQQQGQGRICYLSLGHRGSSFQAPAVKTIIANGLEWITQAARPSQGIA